MSNVFNKILGSIGIVDEEEPVEKVEKQVEEIEEDLDFEEIRETKGKIVSIKSKTITPKIVVKNPQTLGEDMEDLIDALKDKNIVIMNIADAEKNIARRLLDAVSGAVYALECSLQKIDNERGIYLITPKGVEIENELKNILSKSDIFS
ncbi:MAG: cell division protein SepF, partial [Caloramator sp.]|nr:cell division protein SepF [Caloramator sp.]